MKTNVNWNIFLDMERINIVFGWLAQLKWTWFFIQQNTKPVRIQPFVISWQLPTNQRSYCAFVEGHSPLGFISRQWDVIKTTCVLSNSVVFTMTGHLEQRSLMKKSCFFLFVFFFNFVSFAKHQVSLSPVKSKCVSVKLLVILSQAVI